MLGARKNKGYDDKLNAIDRGRKKVEVMRNSNKQWYARMKHRQASRFI